MIATTGPTTLWYLSRGTGVVSLLLLTAAVVLGVAGPLARAAAASFSRACTATSRCSRSPSSSRTC